MTGLIYNSIGTFGVGLILTTYFLLQTERLKANQLRYSIMNFFGSGMILISLIHEFNFPSFIVELVWVLISTMGILRWIWQRNKNKVAA